MPTSNTRWGRAKRVTTRTNLIIHQIDKDTVGLRNSVEEVAFYYSINLRTVKYENRDHITTLNTTVETLS